ncbi:MAG: thioredoxin-disulfide reductase [Alphaproteobacteria bacterium]|nr:thioredoxin-disulfide reductase [Alphaproteobacteria bacterium]
MAEYKTKVLIIGSGPAGYTAGIYAARAGLNPILVSGTQVGGQLTITTDVENFPAFPSPIAGSELMTRMREQAQNVGVKIIEDNIVEVDFKTRPFECSSERNNLFSGETVIICTGASNRWLELESEKKYRGFGVSGCATCDGFFYRGRNVAVIGGGNTAAEEAIYLTNFAGSVTLIHRRDTLRADKFLQDKLRNNNKIHIEWDSVVEEILGTENPLSVNGIRIKNVKTDQQKTLKVDGVFIAIGHHPNTEIFKGQIDLSNDGYIITQPDSCKTNIEGVFAAGDVQNQHFRQAIVAAGSGCIAALEADKFLSKM